MPDVNVSVVTVDSGMDCFEKIQDAISNYQRVVIYDINQLGTAIEQKIRQLRNKLSELQDRLSRADEDEYDEIKSEIYCVQERLDEMYSVQRKHSMIENTYRSQSQNLIASISENTSAGIRDMASYLRHIAGIEENGGTNVSRGVNVFSGDSDYAVVIIDSQKYPESAEHIKSAINQGHPAMLTLNRPGADENRKLSLAGIPERSYADRDEYPPASFSEGGSGAHVAYINSSDNRGSGSSFRWQLSGVPDGTRVRFRVI